MARVNASSASRPRSARRTDPEHRHLVDVREREIQEAVGAAARIARKPLEELDAAIVAPGLDDQLAILGGHAEIAGILQQPRFEIVEHAVGDRAALSCSPRDPPVSRRRSTEPTRMSSRAHGVRTQHVMQTRRNATGNGHYT